MARVGDLERRRRKLSAFDFSWDGSDLYWLKASFGWLFGDERGACASEFSRFFSSGSFGFEGLFLCLLGVFCLCDWENIQEVVQKDQDRAGSCFCELEAW